jgi:hypothetical protein
MEGAHFGPQVIRCWKSSTKLSTVWCIYYNYSCEICFSKPLRFLHWFHLRHQTKRSLLYWVPCRAKEHSLRVTLAKGPIKQLSVHPITETEPIEKVVFKLGCRGKVQTNSSVSSEMILDCVQKRLFTCALNICGNSVFRQWQLVELVIKSKDYFSRNSKINIAKVLKRQAIYCFKSSISADVISYILLKANHRFEEHVTSSKWLCLLPASR